MIFGDLTKYGLRKLPYGPTTQVYQDKKNPLIDNGTVDLIRRGHIKVYGGLKELSGNSIKFDDGKEAEFDAMILATGYSPAIHDFLHDTSSVLDEKGSPISKGKETAISGLFFCGYYIPPTGILRGIAIEAKQISMLIKKGYNR